MNQRSNVVTWVLAIALVLALMVIAFLVGRQSLSGSGPPVAGSPGAGQVAAQGGDFELPGGEPSDEESQAVAAYLEQVNAIEAGPSGLSPNAYAQQLMAEASTGNAAGLDQLLSDLAEAEKKLTALSPPPPCAEYHALLLSSSADARDLLSTLRGALGGTANPAQLESLMGRARAAQQKQQRLQRLRAALERKYGGRTTP